MNTTFFTRVQADERDHVWLLNLLLGDRTCLRSSDWDRIEATPELLDSLTQAGFLGDDKEHLDLWRSLVELSRDVPTWRIGYLLDTMSSQQIAATVDHMRALLAPQVTFGGHVYHYAWWFEQRGADRIEDMVAALRALPAAEKGLALCLRTNGVVPLGEPALRALGDLDVPRGHGLAMFSLSWEAALAAGGVDEYCRGIFEAQARLWSVGITPAFLFQCTKDTVAQVTGPLFESLCFSGIYPRNFSLVFQEAGHPLYRCCELYRTDWDLYTEAAGALVRSPKHSVMEPLAKGVADKLRALLRDGRGTPDTRHCPFSQRSAVFGGDEVTACPVAHLRLEEHPDELRLGRLPQTVNRAARARWDARLPTTGPCGACSVAPICGGGCPLEALERVGDLNGAPCPPIDAILQQEVTLSNPAVSKE